MRKISIIIFSVFMSVISFSQSNNTTKTLIKTTTEASDFVKGPYLLYPADNTKMMLIWQTLSTNTCTVDWGTDETYSSGSKPTVEYGTAHQHKITLDGLTAGTKYFYRVTTNNASTKTSNFISGAADTASVVSFYAYGDTRTYPTTHNAVAKKIIDEINLNPKSQSLIIMSGDIVETGNTESSWTNEFFLPTYTSIQEMLSKLPYLASMGNHEGQGLLFGKYFPYPMYASGRYYYSFDYGPVHFTVLDQYTPYTTGSAQYTWLENDLAASTKPWKIILDHEPGWTANGSGAHSNNTTVQTLIQPLCVKYGVSFIISGHNHFYSRASVGNVMHITSGGGGAPLYNIASQQNILKMDKSNHFCKLDINKNVLNFTAERSDGSIIETFDYVSTVSDVIDVKQNKLFDSFSAYSKENSIIILNKLNLKGFYTVYDNWGQEIVQKELAEISNKVTLKVHGVYYIRIHAEDSFIVKKVIFGNI
jgi:hypothetical protein